MKPQRPLDRTGAGRGGAARPERTSAVAYRRVSKRGQDPENQRADIELVARLRGFEIQREYVETVSAAARTRPEFDAMMLAARRGEFRRLVIWAIDRFGRSMAGNINAVLELDGLGVEVLSVREPWLDMEGPARSLLLAVFSWWAEQERVRISERTRAGLERARARGKKLGRPRRVITPAELERARELRQRYSIRDIAQRLRIPRATLHRALERVSKRGANSDPQNPRTKRRTRGASQKRTIGGR